MINIIYNLKKWRENCGQKRQTTQQTQEDKVLKELLQVKKVSKWSQIARMMASQYGLLGRNGKQCRERYNNHLDSEIKKEEWSQQEQKRLFQLQDEFGNRWSTISKSFEGRQPQNQQFRTDNAIKNYFYSTLRKGIQNINQLITTHFHKQFKILKASIIYKIVEASQKRFNQSDPKTQQTAFACQSIKRGIYQFSKISGQLQQSKIEQLRKLVTQTNQFAKTYRKKKQNKPEKLQQCSDMQQLQDQQYQHVNRNILDFQLNHQNIKSVTTRSTLSKNDHLHETGPSKSNNTFYDGQYNYSSFFISTDFHGNSHSAKDIKNQQYEQTAYTQKFVSLGQNKSKPLRKLFSIGYGPKQQFSSILIEQSYQIQEQSNLPKNENRQEYQSQKSEKKELIFFDDILNKDESFELVD